jgi:hypothetical protein
VIERVSGCARKTTIDFIMTQLGKEAEVHGPIIPCQGSNDSLHQGTLSDQHSHTQSMLEQKTPLIVEETAGSLALVVSLEIA